MAERSILLVLLAFAFQHCFATLPEKINEDLLRLEAHLQNKAEAPTLTVLINGIHSFLSYEDASVRMETMLSETLRMSENKNLTGLINYSLRSTQLVLEQEGVQELISNVNDTLTGDTFNPDNARKLVEQGVQTSYRVFTDRTVLRATRQLLRGFAKILTDPMAQEKISKLMVALAEIVHKQKTLEAIEETVRTLKLILSSEVARKSILTALDSLKLKTQWFSKNNARRVGRMMSKLA